MRLTDFGAVFIAAVFVDLLLKAALILFFVSLAKLFGKAGKEGWCAIVPFYNYFVLSKIATGSGAPAVAFTTATVMIYSFLSHFTFIMSGDGIFSYIPTIFVASLGLVILSMNGYVFYKLGKAFGKSEAWSVCMIFFGAVMIIQMGFDKNISYTGVK